GRPCHRIVRRLRLVARRAVFPEVPLGRRVVVVIPAGAIVIVLATVRGRGRAAAAFVAATLHGAKAAADGRADRGAAKGRAMGQVVADHGARHSAERRAAEGGVGGVRVVRAGRDQYAGAGEGDQWLE